MSKNKVSSTITLRTTRERLKEEFGKAFYLPIRLFEPNQTRIDMLKKAHKINGFIMHWFFYRIGVGRKEKQIIKWVHLCSDFRERNCEDYGYCKHCNQMVTKQVKMLAKLRCFGAGLNI